MGLVVLGFMAGIEPLLIDPDESIDEDDEEEEEGGGGEDDDDRVILRASLDAFGLPTKLCAAAGICDAFLAAKSAFII